MTQEERQLLLADLCARLPYGVMVQDELGRINKLVIGNADLIRLYYNDFSTYGENALSLPLLRPMFSMTEEEEKEYAKIVVKSQNCSFENSESATTMANDWLLSKGFDVRGLISKGLAIEVTEDNNPYEK